MFNFNVIAWGSRAGYDTEEEANEAAKALVREHGVAASVENDRRGVMLRTYEMGADGVVERA